MVTTNGTAKNGKGAPEAVTGINPGDSPEVAEMRRQLAQLKEENAKLAAKKNANNFGEIVVKVKPVTAKQVETVVNGKKTTVDATDGSVQGGVVSVYGLGRFPLSVYGEKNHEVFGPKLLVEIQEAVITHINILRFRGTEEEQAAIRAATLANAKKLLALYKPLLDKFEAVPMPKAAKPAK